MHRSNRSAPAGPLPEHDTAPASRSARRLLIVEDDFLVALELEHQLRSAGFEITGVAATAAEAIDWAGANRPDLAIMDIRLAGPSDGIEAAFELYMRYGIRSIFASAHADPDTKRRGETARPLAWLAKPYSSRRSSCFYADCRPRGLKRFPRRKEHSEGNG